MAGVTNVYADDEVALTADMFYTWDGYGADASSIAAASVDFNIGNDVELGGGSMVCGTSTVDYLTYADLTGSTKLIITGTPGLPLRVLMNRQESNSGPLVEKNPTIGDNGTVELDLTDLQYVHVNAIKVNWGETKGVVSSIKMVKPSDPLAAQKENLSKALSKGKLISSLAYTEASFTVLTNAISAGAAALVADGATSESLTTASTNINNAIDALVLKENFTNLKDVDFGVFSGWGANATLTQKINPTWVLFTATGQSYGDPSVNNRADVSAYDKLYVVTASGSPRILLNRDADGGQWSENESDSHLIDNTKGGWSAKYFSTENGVTIVDLKQLVADKGFAHLTAIKSNDNNVVTGLYLYTAPTYTATFTTNRGWEKVYAYVWSGEGENKLLGDWPGTELTATDGVYTVSIKADAAPANIIFNNGQGGEGNQTADLVFENGKAYEYNVAVEDVLPIDIQFGEKYNSQKVQNYTTTWTATKDGKTWTLVNFNNNNNGWSSVKCGSKSEASVASITSPAINAEVKIVTISVTAAANVNSAKLTIMNGEEKVGEDIDITEKFVAGEVVVPVEGQKGYSYVLTIDNAQAKKNGSVEISKITLVAEVQEPVHIANTAETAYTVVKAIELIEAGEALSETVYVKGIVSRVDDDAFNSTYNSITYWISADGTTDGQQFECYSGKGIEGADFTSKDDIAVGATVIVKGVMKKYTPAEGDPIYEFNYNNELVSYEAPVVLNTYTATFTTNQNWENVYAYAWTTVGEGEGAQTTEFLGEWPGTKLTKNAETGLYEVSIQAAEAPAKIIFNSGAGAQTADLAFEDGKAYEYNALFADGSYYFKNVGTQKFLAAGADWGTHAVVNEDGLDFVVNFVKGKYTFDSQVSNGGNNHFINGSAADGPWTDGASYGWTITKVADGKYTLSNDGGQFIIAGENGKLTFTDDASDEAAQWTVIAAADVDAANLASLDAATAENGVDATFFIKGANFNRNDLRNAAWTHTRNGGNETFAGPSGNRSTYGCEYWNNTFEVSQTITNLPDGIYEFTIAGFATNGTAKLFANDTEADFVNTDANGKDFAGVLDAIAAGEFTGNTTGKVTVIGGTLKIGVKRTSNVNQDWTTFDKAGLIYYGAIPTDQYKTAWQDALAAAQAAIANEAYTVVTGDEKTALAQAITDNTTVDDNKDAYEAAVIALENATSAFTGAQAAYQGLIDAKAAMTGFDFDAYPYATSAKKTAAENALTAEATNAADATEKATAIYMAYRQYAASSAMLEGVEGAVDFTSYIVNPKAEQSIASPWVVESQSGNGSMGILNGEPWTDGENNSTHKYFDGYAWGQSAWDAIMKQEVTLPAGKYQLTVKSRGSQDLSIFRLFAGENSTDMQHIGSTGALFNRGWNDASVEFELTEEATIAIGVQGATETVHNWMSFSDFRLVQLEAAEPAETKLYIIGDGTANAWAGTTEMTYKEETQAFEYIVESEGAIYIAIGDAAFTDWDDFNANHRWAIGTGDQDATVGVATQLQKANGTLKLAAGAYIVSVTKDMQCTITKTVPTGINAIAADRLNGVLYNLNGQKVMKAQKGLYIINGKKVVKK